MKKEDIHSVNILLNKLVLEKFLHNLEVLLRPAEEEKKALKSILKPKEILKNEYFLKEGEICKSIAFIEKGSMRVFYQVEDREVCKDFLFENSVIGSFASFFSQTPSALNIAAMENTLILEMHHDDVMALYDNFPSWQKLGRLIAQEHFIRTEKREASLLKDPPEVRYQNLIEEHPKVFKRIPLKFIASYLGITPETLSRYRTRFRD